MNLPPRLLRFILSHTMLLAPAVARALTLDAGGMIQQGVGSSAAIVEGHPAVAYANSGNTSVRYLRALDARGTTWGTPVTVDSGPAVGVNVCLRIVNDNPAVCYYDQVTRYIKYARATDATGTAWTSPVILDFGGIYQGLDFTMEVVDGKPAVCYDAGGRVGYIRATDASGTSWERGKAVFANPAEFSLETSVKVVEGRPAIALFSLNQFNGTAAIWYLRAMDTAGTAWGVPLKVVSGLNNALHYCSLEVVNGRPAIGFCDAYKGDLEYVRATDATGSAWGVPVTLDRGLHDTPSVSLAIVNGKPAMGYYAWPSLDLKYVQAQDSSGDTAGAWGAPVTVDSTGEVGANAFLMTVNGNPALFYRHAGEGSLKYIRATDQSAGALWPPTLQGEQPAGEIIPDGATTSFGIVPVGTKASLDFTVKNPNSGSAELIIQNITIDGPDAAEFSVTTLPAPEVAAGDATAFTIQYAPLTPGIKDATFRLASNAESPGDAWHFMLQGDSLPDIAVESPAGTNVGHGSSLNFPLTAAGTRRDLSFTVRNPGGAELQGMAITIDGRDAGEFSIAAPPAAAVAPGGSTTFTLRHTPVTAGGKTASLHLVSNVAGNRSPFDLTVRMVPGTLDPDFHPATGGFQRIAVQADGRILAAGPEGLSRFNPGGTIDASFFSPSFDFTFIHCIAVQKDAKILVGGSFTRVGGQPRLGLARLLADGSLDEAFSPGLPVRVECLAVQPDGKILLGGNTDPGVEDLRPILVRLHANGSLDLTFHPVSNEYIACLALQPDGKILTGAFPAFPPTPDTRLARLLPDGTPDVFPALFTDGVKRIVVQPDGRILAAGTNSGGVRRFLPSGERDLSLTFHDTGFIGDLALQADGRCLVSGNFNIPGDPSRIRVTRFDAGGTVDTDFIPNPDGLTGPLELQADGKVLLFFSTGGQPSPNLVRLDSDPAVSLLNAAGRSTVRWLRGGSAPEVHDVTYDAKPDNASDWTRLGSAQRIPGGWELTGLTLPSSGTLRAQAYAGGSVIESTVPILTTLESWRLQHFNTSTNSGDAADDADPDHDGLTNFTEFAFGLSPVDRASNTLPEFNHDGAFFTATFTATFTAPAGRDDVIYGAEWSPTMQPHTWTAIPDTGTDSMHTFRAPGGAGRVFVRFVIKRQ